MKISPFKLERYFAKYEFSTKYLLSCSDCESVALPEILALADTDTLRLWENLALGYTESQGNPLLREEIARLYTTLAPKEVLVCAPEEGIFIAMNALLEKGDHVICTFPGYQSLYQIAESIGCSVSKWEIQQNNGSWSFDPQDIEQLIQPNTKLVVVNFPHNPTGAVLSQNELSQLIEIIRQKNIALFSDEMYRGLEYDKNHQTLSAADLYENAIALYGMSKTFGMPGLRIGWLASKNKGVLEQCLTLKDYTTICPSAPSEILALMGLRAKDHLIKRSLTIIEDNLKALNMFFDEFDHLFEWQIPKAGPIAFVRLKFTKDAQAFCETLVKECGIMLLPSTVYEFGNQHVRFGFGRKNVPAILKILKEHLQNRAKKYL